jgi:hypothetical protein
VTLDTTGTSLHKRGYRTEAGAAPISETLAAALIMLTPWHGDRILLDPMCGSGTFPIEAAMMAANIAPGMNRSFTAEKWTNFIDRKLWIDAKAEAREAVDTNIETDIQGFDVDPDVLKIARENAKRAGVADLIHFQVRDVKDTHHPKKYGFIITTLINWAIWTVWHIPLCFIKGTYQYSGSYLWFAISLLASAFSLAALHSIKGSIMPCILFHAIGNAVVSYGLSISDGTGALISYGVQIIFAILVSYFCKRTSNEPLPE